MKVIRTISCLIWLCSLLSGCGDLVTTKTTTVYISSDELGMETKSRGRIVSIKHDADYEYHLPVSTIAFRSSSDNVRAAIAQTTKTSERLTPPLQLGAPRTTAQDFEERLRGRNAMAFCFSTDGIWTCVHPGNPTLASDAKLLTALSKKLKCVVIGRLENMTDERYSFIVSDNGKIEREFSLSRGKLIADNGTYPRTEHLKDDPGRLVSEAWELLAPMTPPRDEYELRVFSPKPIPPALLKERFPKLDAGGGMNAPAVDGAD
jgi:hypothetical protein